jgi:hypothetical protein
MRGREQTAVSFLGCLAGVDPITMLTGPIPATTTVLEPAKLSLDDIDAVKINESFASVERDGHVMGRKSDLNQRAIRIDPARGRDFESGRQDSIRDPHLARV